MSSLRTAVSDVTGLYSIFGDRIEDMPRGRFISAEEMPQPYRDLLAHHDHMTVTMEEFHHTPVDVKVIRAVRDDPYYARKILLTRTGTEEVVMFGIMRFNFEWCDDRIKELIVGGQIPLGRILIENDVLRRISTHVLLRITPNVEMREWFRMADPASNAAGNGNVTSTFVYGRLATIYCNDEPAVDLLEVSAPVG
jgi:chorismate-pyruvate lyase